MSTKKLFEIKEYFKELEKRSGSGVTLSPILISVLAELLDDFDLFGVVGVETGTEKVVLPLGDVDIPPLTGVDTPPHGFPGFVGLGKSRYKSPVPAAHLFQIEEREHLFNGVVERSVEPFGIEQRTVVLPQFGDVVDIGMVTAVAVVTDNVGVFQSHLFCRFEILAASPDS